MKLFVLFADPRAGCRDTTTLIRVDDDVTLEDAVQQWALKFDKAAGQPAGVLSCFRLAAASSAGRKLKMHWPVSELEEVCVTWHGACNVAGVR